MKYLLDTADRSEILNYKDMICGVTSNPIILKKSDKTMSDFIEENRLDFDMIFVQIDTLFDLKEVTKGGVIPNVIYKIPLIKEKYSLLRVIAGGNAKICGTITYDLIQFHQACDMGCDYSIVLMSKNDNKEILDQCVNLKNRYGYETKIVAASFREKTDVINAMLGGADYATLTPEVMKKCLTNRNAEYDYHSYYRLYNKL